MHYLYIPNQVPQTIIPRYSNNSKNWKINVMKPSFLNSSAKCSNISNICNRLNFVIQITEFPINVVIKVKPMCINLLTLLSRLLLKLFKSINDKTWGNQKYPHEALVVNLITFSNCQKTIVKLLLIVHHTVHLL